MKTSVLVLNTFLGDKNTTRFSIVFIVLFIFLYIVLINRTVLSVVDREQAEAKNRVLSTEISELEFRYITLSSHLDLARATELGFKEVKAPVFANRNKTNALTFKQ